MRNRLESFIRFIEYEIRNKHRDRREKKSRRESGEFEFFTQK
jgi:hypothetical protein